MTRKNKIYFLFVLGLSLGILFAINKVKASSPESDASSYPISMYYDEYWQATNSIVSSANGFVELNPSSRGPTGTAASLDNATTYGWVVRVFPKMVVTRWRVRGHIHFE